MKLSILDTIKRKCPICHSKIEKVGFIKGGLAVLEMHKWGVWVEMRKINNEDELNALLHWLAYNYPGVYKFWSDYITPQNTNNDKNEKYRI